MLSLLAILPLALLLDAPALPSKAPPAAAPSQPAPPAPAPGEPAPPDGSSGSADPLAAGPPTPPALPPEQPAAAPAPPSAPPQPPAYYPYPYPYPPPSQAPAPPKPRKPIGPDDVPDAVKYRRLVFTNHYTLNFGIFSPIPSGDFSFFLGSSLLPRKHSLRMFDWNTAVGYQLTLSVGLADSSTLAVSPSQIDGIFFHRHHLTVTGIGGQRQRFYYSVGGGAWLWMSQFVGVEGEARLGIRFAVREDSRASGVFGLQTRLSGAVRGAPMPQFGLFLGFMIF